MSFNLTHELIIKKCSVHRSPPVALVSVMEASGTLVKLLVQGVRAGDRVTTQLHSSEYTAAMTYLLAWRHMLAFFNGAPSEVQYCVIL